MLAIVSWLFFSFKSPKIRLNLVDNSLCQKNLIHPRNLEEKKYSKFDPKLTGTYPPTDTIHYFYMAIIMQLPLLSKVGSISQSELKPACRA